MTFSGLIFSTMPTATKTIDATENEAAEAEFRVCERAWQADRQKLGEYFTSPLLRQLISAERQSRQRRNAALARRAELQTRKEGK